MAQGWQAAVAAIACGLQLVIALCTFLYLVIFECSLVPRDSGLSFNEVAIVEQGKRRDEKVSCLKYLNLFVFSMLLI